MSCCPKPVPAQSQMAQVTTSSMPKRSSNISQSRRCPENGEAASSKGAPPRGLTAFGTDIWDDCRMRGTPRIPEISSEIITSHKATSQPAEASQSCLLRLSRRGLVRFRWWEATGPPVYKWKNSDLCGFNIFQSCRIRSLMVRMNMKYP